MAASPKAIEKVTSGNIAPSAAARIGFAGTMSASHCARLGSCCACWTTDAAPGEEAMPVAAGPALESPAKRYGTVSAAIAVLALSKATKIIRARAPVRPADRTSGKLVMLTNSDEITSGITVIRIALIHNCRSSRHLPRPKRMLSCATPKCLLQSGDPTQVRRSLARLRSSVSVPWSKLRPLFLIRGDCLPLAQNRAADDPPPSPSASAHRPRPPH